MVPKHVWAIALTIVRSIDPDKVVDVSTAIDQRLKDYGIWRNDFVSRYRRDPEPDEIYDGFCTERWPKEMVDKMRADYGRVVSSVETGGSGGVLQ